MSDIPPELLEQAQPEPSSDRSISHDMQLICRSVLLSLLVSSLAIILLALFMPCAHAATLDRTDVYCELFEQDQANYRYYIAADPPWTPECANPWVTLRKEKFQTLVDAYEGGSGSSTTPQFTADEVAALKLQAANPSPFNLSVEDGAYISALIGGVWALAWGWKQLGLFASDDRSFD